MENEKNLEAKQRIESCWMTFEKDDSSCARRSVQDDHHQEPPPHFRWNYLRHQSLHSGPHLRYKTKFSMTIPNNLQEVHNAIGCVGSKQVYEYNKTRLPCFCSMGCCKQRERGEEGERFYKLYCQQRIKFRTTVVRKNKFLIFILFFIQYKWSFNNQYCWLSHTSTSWKGWFLVRSRSVLVRRFPARYGWRGFRRGCSPGSSRTRCCIRCQKKSPASGSRVFHSSAVVL